MPPALRSVALVAAVFAVTIVLHRVGVARHMTPDGMHALVEAWGPYGPLAFMAVCVAGIFLHVPEIVLVAIGGVVFGTVRGFAYGWIASLVGTTSTFLVVRYAARDHFQRVLDRRFARLRALDQRLERNGFWTVLALRLVLFLAPPLNWALGATRVRLPHYVAGTALGVIPGMAATVFFADTLAHRPPGAPLLSPRVVLAAVAVMLALAGVAVASRRLLGRGASG